jgi:predicted transposase/invertase (TIGR01784 family)
MSEDESNRMIYEARLKARRDEYSRMEGARREGREEGRAEGWEEGETKATRKIVVEMSKHGMDINAIVAITHLSQQEIGSILKEGNV